MHERPQCLDLNQPLQKQLENIRENTSIFWSSWKRNTKSVGWLPSVPCNLTIFLQACVSGHRIYRIWFQRLELRENFASKPKVGPQGDPVLADGNHVTEASESVYHLFIVKEASSSSVFGGLQGDHRDWDWSQRCHKVVPTQSWLQIYHLYTIIVGLVNLLANYGAPPCRVEGK